VTDTPGWNGQGPGMQESRHKRDYNLVLNLFEFIKIPQFDLKLMNNDLGANAYDELVGRA